VAGIPERPSERLGAAVAVAVDPPVGVLRRTLARLVWGLHTSLVVFVVVAWALPTPGAWWSMIVLAPVMTIQWRLNDDTCLLTDLEHHLRRTPSAGRPEQGSFISDLLRPIVGEVSERAIDWIGYGVLWSSCAGCVLRLLLRG
jgi:hypothetical protein